MQVSKGDTLGQTDLVILHLLRLRLENLQYILYLFFYNYFAIFLTQSQLPSYWLNTINLSLYKSMQFFLYKDEFMPANSQLGLKNIFNIFPFFSLIVIYTSQSITILFHTTLWLHLTNIPLFQTLHLGLHPCLLHLSWSCTCI